MMKYSPFLLLPLWSSPMLAHPGHAPGVSYHALPPLVLVLVLVVTCLFCYGLYRERADSTKNDRSED